MNILGSLPQDKSANGTLNKTDVLKVVRMGLMAIGAWFTTAIVPQLQDIHFVANLGPVKFDVQDWIMIGLMLLLEIGRRLATGWSADPANEPPAPGA